ncbi:MarC family protein [Caulobacter sp. S45]|uniref:MarC family protein n=1 Tax=Caulobacter sp. S45 TaxID=1641861 RepID=UPI00131E14FA|nr:MarC family protein [Caulobacter sp. S45]
MTPVAFAVNVFVALFALLDPVGMAPLFAAATLGAPASAQRRIALYVSLFAMVFMAFFFLTGTAMLKFFGISMPAFRIAGGLMLLLMGLNMARDDFSTMFADAAVEGEEALSSSAYAKKRFESLVVPFGMPLLVGPGAISAAVIYADEARPLGWAGYAAGLAGICGVCVCVLVAFLASRLISRALGKIGMTIVVRVLGLVLTAMAVQFIIVGVSGATLGVVRGSAAHPYPVKATPAKVAPAKR